MTPHTQPQRPRASARRAIAIAAGVAVLGAAPLVASALGDDSSESIESAITTALLDAATTVPLAEPVAPTAGDEADDEPDAMTATRSAASDSATASPEPQSESESESESEPEPEPEPDPEPEPQPEEVIAALVDSYAWDERGPRVETLQAVLGIEVDGWYGAETARVHRSALGYLGASTDNVPEAPTPVIPPGPSASAWASLRNCESGGNYSITNPSGTYRGAYQFNRSTWDSVASRHAPGLVGVDPAAAAPADQDAMAYALYGERGSSPWPHCGRYLG